MKGKVSFPNLSHERVREALDYNPATGEFTWRIRPAYNVPAGSNAGRASKGNGYLYITLNGVEVTAARLAWFYMNGEWPKTKIQFKDGNKLNCSFENLVLSNGVHGEHDFSTKEGRQAYQKAYRLANPDKEKARGLKDSFDLSLEQYQEMHDRQNGKCKICGQPEKQKINGKIRLLAVDHCHKSGNVRGLLCSDCNTGIGKLKDSIEVLQSAIRYLTNPGSLALSTGPADSAQTIERNLVQEV